MKMVSYSFSYIYLHLFFTNSNLYWRPTRHHPCYTPLLLSPPLKTSSITSPPTIANHCVIPYRMCTPLPWPTHNPCGTTASTTDEPRTPIVTLRTTLLHYKKRSLRNRSLNTKIWLLNFLVIEFSSLAIELGGR